MSNLTFYIIGGIAWLASLAIRSWLNAAYKKYGAIKNSRGLTGAETASAILRGNGLNHVTVESVKGNLTDHYDPRFDVVRLSTSNYQDNSIAALAVSAHETGHALQDAHGYRFMKLRSTLVPMVSLGAKFGPYAFIYGLATNATIFIQVGALLFAGSVLFHLVTLPVEFNASRRALRQIEELGLVSDTEKEGVKKLLTAAGMTYVAGAATSFAYFLYMLALSRRSR